MSCPRSADRFRVDERAYPGARSPLPSPKLAGEPGPAREGRGTALEREHPRSHCRRATPNPVDWEAGLRADASRPVRGSATPPCPIPSRALRTLVVTPTYDEAENVVSLVTRVLEQSNELEVLVVDDASPDGTGDLVAARMEEEPRLHLIRREGKLGLGDRLPRGVPATRLERGLTTCVLDDGLRLQPSTPATCRTCSPRRPITTSSSDRATYREAESPTGPCTGARSPVLVRERCTRGLLLRMPVHDCTAGFRCYRVARSC